MPTFGGDKLAYNLVICRIQIAYSIYNFVVYTFVWNSKTTFV